MRKKFNNKQQRPNTRPHSAVMLDGPDRAPSRAMLYPTGFKTADFGKPIILSTGASYLWEIQEAVEVMESHNVSLCLMHCVLNYPTENQNANLGMLTDIKRKFPD